MRLASVGCKQQTRSDTNACNAAYQHYLVRQFHWLHAARTGFVRRIPAVAMMKDIVILPRLRADNSESKRVDNDMTKHFRRSA